MIYTSNQAFITLSVPGVTLDNKSWDKFSGGGRTADTQNFPPGGMQPSVATGGVTKRNQITLERAWDDTLIGAALTLDAAVNGPCATGVVPLQNATTTVPAGLRNFTGVIKEVTWPENDSTSSSISMLSVVIEPNEPITG